MSIFGRLVADVSRQKTAEDDVPFGDKRARHEAD
jgi:hypothetical protein